MQKNGPNILTDIHTTVHKMSLKLDDDISTISYRIIVVESFCVTITLPNHHLSTEIHNTVYADEWSQHSDRSST